MYLQSAAVDISSCSSENYESPSGDLNTDNSPDGTVHILVVDDHIQIPQLLQKRLEKDGYAVSIATSAQQALIVIENYGFPDLAILDIVMPGTDGLALADRLKKVGNVPIIFLSAYSNRTLKASAINLYGEDYIDKPYKYQELLARIRRILSRFSAKHDKPIAEAVIGNRLRVNFEQQFALLDGSRISLTLSETVLLKFLCENRGNVVPAELLLEEIHGPGHNHRVNSLHVQVRRLRAKIEADPSHPRYVVTVHGKGYMMPESSSV